MDISIYVSSDEVECADARQLGYRDICTHPKQIGVLKPGQMLVIHFDGVLFDDRDDAVLKASQAALLGVRVGIHTYYPGDPRLHLLLKLPNVVVAKTHRRVLAKLRQRVRNHPSQPMPAGEQAQLQESEVNHVHEHPDGTNNGRANGVAIVPSRDGRRTDDDLPALPRTG